MPEAKTPLVFAAGGHHNGSANSERSDSFPWGAGSSTGSQGPSESAQSLSLRPQSTRRKSSQTRTPTANPKVTSSTPPFSLVTRNSAGSSADGSDEPAEKTAPNEQRVKVLLVEDNDVNMKVC